MIHKPQPQLNILTPLPDIAPFTEQSINKAFNFWVNPQNWVLGQKLLALIFDLNQVLFTWAFDKSFKSSFILFTPAKINSSTTTSTKMPSNISWKNLSFRMMNFLETEK